MKRNLVYCKFIPLLCFLVASLFTVSQAHAQRMSKKSCAGANWQMLGAEDALNGRSSEAFIKRNDKCSKYNIPVNQSAWSDGYNTMLGFVCRNEFAYGLGTSGKSLDSACDKYGRLDAHQANSIGIKYFHFQRAYDSAANDYDYSVNRIDQAHATIKHARSQLAKSDLTQGDRDKYRGRIAKSRKTISQLENGVVYKRQALERAQANLERYRLVAQSYERGLERERLERGPDAFDPPLAISAIVQSGKSDNVVINLVETITPVLVDTARIYIPDFAGPTSSVEEFYGCRIRGKYKRQLSRAWRGLRGKPLSFTLYEMDLLPPSFNRSWEMVLIGDGRLEGNQELIDYFEKKKLIFPEGAHPPIEWFRKKDCFTQKVKDLESGRGVAEDGEVTTPTDPSLNLEGREEVLEKLDANELPDKSHLN